MILMPILRTKLGGYGPVGKQVLVVPSMSPDAASRGSAKTYITHDKCTT